MPMEREQIRSKIADTLDEVGRVLDVGCGNCDLVRFLARELAQEAVGIDLRTDLVHEHLHSERDGGERTARCQKADAQHMDEFEDGHFDAVVSAHALHEIADPDAALREMRRVLKEGGTLLIADFTQGESRWKERYFTPAQAQAMLQEAGFAEIEVEKVPGEHFMFAVARK
jgi:ubiquinone/menaquinone biosynthesis C-methylase UbiE